MFTTVFLLALIAIASADVAPWTGQIADHINGQLVQDTPEVAQAKAQHYRAYSQIAAVLPELPPEIRYQQHGLVNPIPQQQQIHHAAFVPQQQVINHAAFVPQQQHQVLAEEIPRSDLGETPEVYEARVAHLKAVQHFNTILPKLGEQTVQNSVPLAPAPLAPIPVVHHQAAVPQLNGDFLQDTPEVAAAKAEHARIVAALG